MRLSKNALGAIKKNTKTGAPKAVELEPCTEPLVLTAEGIGGFFQQAKLRRVSSVSQEEYQKWVDGLDPVRQTVLVAYELGYLHGTFDGREGRPIKKL